jgi:hypothetical protein
MADAETIRTRKEGVNRAFLWMFIRSLRLRCCLSIPASLVRDRMNILLKGHS